MENFWKTFTAQQKALLKRVIEVAEMDTSGEIRVHIENRCQEDPLDRAVHVFAKLEMHMTQKRNGVLFYLAVKDRQLVILGDAGINAIVPPDFWNNITETVLSFFRDGKFTEGLAEGIRMAGEQLKRHFPYQADDVNELPDDISFGEDVHPGS
ncbi:MAG: TPM domain-containing protein [Bacteroidota bacterium]